MSTQDTIGTGTIVTPEAVALDFQIAGIASRALAFMVDFFIQVVAAIILTIVAAAVGTGSGVAGIIVALVGAIAIVIGYPATMETLNGGRTLGRMVLGTRVVTVEGAPIRFRHAFIRALLAIVDHLISLGGVAIVTAMVTRRGQRLGDLVAGTMVIRERTSKLQSDAVSFWRPTDYDAYINSMDTAGLGEERYRLVRDFLTRLDDMSPQHQTRLADEIAGVVQQRLALHPPPPGMTSITYLFAVIAAAQPASASPLGMPPPPVPGPPTFPAPGSANPTWTPPPPVPASAPQMPSTAQMPSTDQMPSMAQMPSMSPPAGAPAARPPAPQPDPYTPVTAPGSVPPPPAPPSPRVPSAPGAPPAPSVPSAPTPTTSPPPEPPERGGFSTPG